MEQNKSYQIIGKHINYDLNLLFNRKMWEILVLMVLYIEDLTYSKIVEYKDLSKTNGSNGSYGSIWE